MRPAAAVLVLVAALLLAGCTSPEADPTKGLDPHVIEDYETPFVLWAIAGDVPTDPATGNPRPWSVTVSDGDNHSPTQALRFEVDGTGGEAVVWITRQLLILEAHEYNAEGLSWAHHGEGFPAQMVLHIGSERPESADDFDPAEFRDLIPGNDWSRHAMRWHTTGLPDGVVFVSLGVRVVGGPAVVYFDDSEARAWRP